MESVKIEDDGELSLSRPRFRKQSLSLVLGHSESGEESGSEIIEECDLDLVDDDHLLAPPVKLVDNTLLFYCGDSCTDDSDSDAEIEDQNKERAEEIDHPALKNGLALSVAIKKETTTPAISGIVSAEANARTISPMSLAAKAKRQQRERQAKVKLIPMYLPSPFNQSRNPSSTSIKEENQPPQNGHSGGIHRPTESKPAASSAIAASFMPNLSGASSEQPIRDPSPRHTRRESVDLINDFLKHPPRRRVMQANSPSPPPRLRRASTRALSFDILHTLFDPPTEPATPPTAKKPKVDRPCQVEQATTQTPSPTPWAPTPLQHTLPAGLGINLVALPPRHFTAASAPRDAAGRRLFSDEELRAPRPGAPGPAPGGRSAGGHVGIYTPAERRERLARFHAKRQRRVWRKKTRYGCRKRLADARPRVQGRFARRDAAVGEAAPLPPPLGRTTPVPVRTAPDCPFGGGGRGGSGRSPDAGAAAAAPLLAGEDCRRLAATTMTPRPAVVPRPRPPVQLSERPGALEGAPPGGTRQNAGSTMLAARAAGAPPLAAAGWGGMRSPSTRSAAPPLRMMPLGQAERRKPAGIAF